MVNCFNNKDEVFEKHILICQPPCIYPLSFLQTPLYLATRNGQNRIIQHLLKANANRTSSCFEMSETALAWACSMGSQVVETFLTQTCNIDTNKCGSCIPEINIKDCSGQCILSIYKYSPVTHVAYTVNPQHRHKSTACTYGLKVLDWTNFPSLLFCFLLLPHVRSRQGKWSLHVVYSNEFISSNTAF